MLNALIHWVHDFLCINEDPTLDELDQASFRNALDVATERASVCKEESENADTLSHETAPGKLKDERKWALWVSAFETMLSTIPDIM